MIHNFTFLLPINSMGIHENTINRIWLSQLLQNYYSSPITISLCNSNSSNPLSKILTWLSKVNMYISIYYLGGHIKEWS